MSIDYTTILAVSTKVNSNVHEHKFTLSQAHKVLKKMRQELTVLTKEYGVSTVYSSLYLKNSVESLKLNNMELEEKFIKYNLLLHDISLLKNRLYYTNGILGLDTILSEIDLLLQLKQQYISMIKLNKIDSININNVTDELFMGSKIGSYQNTLYTIIHYNIEDLNLKIDSLSKQITTLESKRDHLNATEKITIPIYDIVSTLIGL